MKLTEERINELISRGANRWTKGQHDRLYINPETVGLECDYYNTGNIRYAALKGEEISNSRANKIRASKVYIDINSGKLVNTSTDPAYIEAVNEFIGGLV